MPAKKSVPSAAKPASAAGSSSAKSPIGAWLKAARLKRNTTQAELARAMGVAQEMLAQIENGDESPGAALHAKLRAWISSGSRPGAQPKRGPYRT